MNASQRIQWEQENQLLTQQRPSPLLLFICVEITKCMSVACNGSGQHYNDVVYKLESQSSMKIVILRHLVRNYEKLPA